MLLALFTYVFVSSEKEQVPEHFDILSVFASFHGFPYPLPDSSSSFFGGFVRFSDVPTGSAGRNFRSSRGFFNDEPKICCNPPGDRCSCLGFVVGLQDRATNSWLDRSASGCTFRSTAIGCIRSCPGRRRS